MSCFSVVQNSPEDYPCDVWEWMESCFLWKAEPWKMSFLLQHTYIHTGPPEKGINLGRGRSVFLFKWLKIFGSFCDKLKSSKNRHLVCCSTSMIQKIEKYVPAAFLSCHPVCSWNGNPLRFQFTELSSYKKSVVLNTTICCMFISTVQWTGHNHQVTKPHGMHSSLVLYFSVHVHKSPDIHWRINMLDK